MNDILTGLRMACIQSDVARCKIREAWDDGTPSSIGFEEYEQEAHAESVCKQICKTLKAKEPPCPK